MSNSTKTNSSLTPAKRQLLAMLRKQQGVEAEASLRIPRRSVEGPCALSFAQQRLWFLDQLEPGSYAYNMPVVVRISGDLNVGLLERSLNEIIRRHETLRTSFTVARGVPAQAVAPDLSLTVEVVDLRHLPGSEGDEEVRRRSVAAARQPFDLGRAPLIRAQVLRLDEAEFVLLLTLHHIISDGWSMGVLIQEITTLYRAYSEGRVSPLPELAVQYADFALWQRERLQGQVLEDLLAYWRRQLGDRPEARELPTDYPRPPVQTFRGAQCSFVLSPALTAAVKELSRREGVTLFMTLLAGWQTLLARYSGDSESTVGTPIANRQRVATEHLIGFFVNTLVMRASLPPDITFKSLLKQVQETALGAYAHQDLPFEKLVEELQPERSLSHTPLFQVMFALQNAPSGVLETAGLKLTLVSHELEEMSAKFDLFLSLEETAGGIKGTLRYNADLFAEATISRLIAHLERVFESVTANPEQPVWSLSLLREDERERLLNAWNDTRTEYPRASPVHELYEAQAAAHPGKVAVTFGEQQVTYGELNERANRLAHHLRARGVAAEVRVCVCLERSVDLIVSLLAILKAGGAYVPLDPSYPEQRLAFMAGDARVSVLITQPHLRPRLADVDAQIICLSGDAAEIARHQGAQPPHGQVRADNLAYVMYTSGSTGQPKGVGITHRNVVRLVRGTDYADFNAEEVFLQLAPVSFDASTFEIWGSLLNGGRLVVMPPQTPTLEELGEALHRYEVTTLWLTAGLFHQMADQQLAALNGVRQLLAGGDALSVVHVGKTLAERGTGCLINGYGPTETTTFACCYRMHSGDEIGRSVPIGRPIANTTVYVLDGEMQGVPVGVAGELYIGGDGVGRGYLNDAELTAQRFVPHPFSDAPGERLYRTGDRVRYLDDGRIEFLGRLDEQVKLRGYRIEVGEIEAALDEHPAVGKSVVQMISAASGDKRLIAYAAWVDAPPTARELRGYLRSRLPEYMIPSQFVLLEELPLTPNGKVDRRALPAPEADRPELEAEYVAARTPTEEIMVGIWAEVLGVERVGIHDSFFELGGHSLLGTQVMSRVREAFKVEIPLKSLFESPTVAELSAHVEAAQNAGWQLDMPPIVSSPRVEGAPLSFAQSRMWFHYQMEPESALYNIAVAIRIEGALDAAALEQSLQEIVRRHETLRTTFDALNDQPVQIIAPEMPLPLTITDLSELAPSEREAEVRRLKKAEGARPFDFARGPLLRAGLLRLSANEHVLLLTMHHIISDGWSLGILIREVVQFYEAFSRQQPVNFVEPLRVQYGDFARWQRQALQGERLEKLLSYWKRQLSGLSPVLDLPTDHPRPVIQSYRGARQSRKMPALLTEHLRKLARQEGVTQFVLLLAAFKLLLHRYTGQTDIGVGVGIANRTRVETENLIGFFANTLVLRSDLSGNPTFRELLTSERAVALDGYAHQDLPFEKLVEELQPERSLSHMPLFQVMFSMQNVPLPELELPGIKLNIEEHEDETSKFDLMLSVSEAEQQLAFTFEYSTDLFEAATISRMFEHFQTLLTHIVEDADRPLSDLPLMTEEEQQRVLVRFNDTYTEFPRHLAIHQLFEERARHTPGAPALLAHEASDSLTYGELNERANRLAHHLRARGVATEVRVGVCLERSVDLIVSLLAILKAGGVYVPLDPAYPAARLALMVEDAGAELVITRETWAAEFEGMQGVRELVALDREEERIASYGAENPGCEVWPDNLAYVMYTSGSTGRPKGVGVTHRNVLRLVCNTNYVSFSPEEVFLQFAPISFDASTFEIWGSLLNGGRLALAPAGALSLAELGEVIARHGVTTLWLTAGLFNQMVGEGAAGLGSVRQLLAGGDVLSATHVRQALELLPGARVVNGYGPTEATTFSCCHVMEHSAEVGESVLIGRPIANTQVYILDEAMRAVAVGVAGELYIGGEGLMRGYVNEPELTAQRLVPHPYASAGGERLYRTGDVARWLADGHLEFIGRADNQVKIRGFRIEPGEVEAALREQSGIEDCAVMVRESAEGGKRLVAYCVRRGEAEFAELGAGQLRAQLKQRLPDYMLPAQVVMLDALPLTPNGKVDWKALPEPSESREAGAATEPPRTPVEELLVGIWEESLGIEGIGIRDNFFELGGHSLLATQVMVRTRKALNVNVPLRHFFESPTVAEFARIVEAHLKDAEEMKEPPLRRVARNGEPMPLSFSQQRLWFAEQLEPGNSTYTVPAAIRLTGKLDFAALERSCQEIVRRHESLRTVFTTVGGVPMQSVLPELESPLPLIELEDYPEAEREAAAIRLARQEALRPFNLNTGPLFRAVALRLGEREHILVLIMHHIISDGWSMSVLIEEMTALYVAFSAGQPSPLPELPIQYADFTLWQREWMQSEVLEKQLAYWKKQLGEGLEPLELPTDHPRPATQSFRGTTQKLSLPRSLWDELKELSRRAGTTQFMTLLAAFQSLLYRYSGQEDIVVGTTVANRNHAETEKLIGFFVNMLVLRTDLSGNPTFLELLGRVREVTLGAYTHQDLPFDKLVEALRPERTLSSSPLFQVVFSLQHARELTLPELDLKLSSVEIDWAATQFDLIVRAMETPHGLTVLMTYNADLFEDTTITRLLQHYEAWLGALISHAGQPLLDIPLKLEGQREEWDEPGGNSPLMFASDQFAF